MAALQQRDIKPHIARNTSSRQSVIDARSARGKGHAMSMQVRKRIKQVFGWVKTIDELRKPPFTGMERVRGCVAWNFAAYNLIRLGGIAEWWNPSPT